MELQRLTKNRNIFDAKQEVDRLLTIKFCQPNGQVSNIFTIVESFDIQRFCCSLCCKNDMGVSKLISHAKGKNHQHQLRVISEKYSSSIQRKTLNAQSFPEGFQAQLNEINDQVIIGAEYIIEVDYGEGFESIFYCVLCEGKFNLQVVVNHLTAFAHRSKYLEKHFPTVFKNISALDKREEKYAFLEKVCHSIEHYYGRLSMKVVNSHEFSANQMRLYDDILQATHFDETLGRTFTEIFHGRRNTGRGLSPISDFDEISSTCSLESLSSSDEFKVVPFKPSGKKSLSSRALSAPDDREISLSSISAEESSLIDDGNFFDFTRSSSRSVKHEQRTYNDKKFYKPNVCERKKTQHDVRALKSVCHKVKKTESNDEKVTPKPQENKHERHTSRIHSSVHQNRNRSRSPHSYKPYIRRCRESSQQDHGLKAIHYKYDWQRNSLPQSVRGTLEPAGGSGYQSTFYERDNGMADSFFYNYPPTANITPLRKGYSPINTSVESGNDDEEPVTVISVLSLLAAFEHLLGCLGPKIIELMSEAIAMEKIEINLSNSLLESREHLIVFDTMKEKLKGLLVAGLVEYSQIKTIQKIIHNVDVLMRDANARQQQKTQFSQFGTDAKETSTAASSSQIEGSGRSAIATKMLIALKKQGRTDVSEVEMQHYVDQYLTMASAKSTATVDVDEDSDHGCDNIKVELPTTNTKSTDVQIEIETYESDIHIITTPETTDDATAEAFASKLVEPTRLDDSNLTTLIKNFEILSDAEKQDVIANIRDIEINDPERMIQLRSKIQMGKVLVSKLGSQKLRQNKAVTVKLKSEFAEN